MGNQKRFNLASDSPDLMGPGQCRHTVGNGAASLEGCYVPAGRAQCQLSFQGLRSNWINNRKVKRTTYSNSVPKARARLGAGSTYVVTNTGVLTGCTVEVCNWAWAVCPWKSSGPGGVGACRGSGCAKIRLSTVAIQDWCAENKARYEARSRACTSITKPNTPNKNKKQPRSNF